MLSGMPVTNGSEVPARMAIMLWGDAGCGKTTFAATAPGDKLWLSFGDQEHVSVMRRKDVHVLKVYEMGLDELFNAAQNDNPFGLDAYLADHANIETVVCDSLTALAYRGLQKAVKRKIGGSNSFTPTMEMPGISAYGGRNAIALEVLTGLLKVTAKHNVHLIATAHESDPKTRNENNREVIDYIGVMLGGQLVSNVTYRLSEIWYMSQSTTGEKHRRLMIRPTRLRRPAKTRMFTAKDEAEFNVHYDADRPDDAKGQMTIAKWFNAWIEAGGDKLPLPKASRSGDK
jgi:hypothetical protein